MCFLPDTNTVFDTVLTMAVALYSIVYIMILISGVRYRKNNPGNKGSFRIPGGKIGAWIVTVAGLIGTVSVLVISLIPPASTPAGMQPFYTIFMIAGRRYL